LFSFFKSKGQQQTQAQKNGPQNNQTPAPRPSVPSSLLQQSIGNQATGSLVQQQTQGGSGGTPPVQQPSPEEQRKTALAQERELQAPAIAAALFPGIRTTAAERAKAFLNNDKEALALRDSVKAAATAAVEANIDGAGVTAEEAADAKQYAADHVQKAGIVAKALERYADGKAGSAVPDDYLTLIGAKAKEGFNQVAPKPKTPLDKQKAEAMKLANKAALAETNRLKELVIGNVTTSMKEAIKQNAKFLDSGLDVGDLGKDEAELRQQLDGQLVQDADINTVYTNSLIAPIKQAVLMKLGVGRRAFRRSKELNEFRQGMKDAAREQARSDIDGQLDTNALTSNKGNVAKQYLGMVAKTKAHSTSKVSVDKVMEQKADAIVKTLLPADATKKQLKTAAQTSAYGVARSDQSATEKIRAAALGGASAKAIAIYKAKQTEAVAAARKITKGDKATSAGPDAAQRTALSGDVKNQVTTDDVAGAAIKHAVEAGSVNSGLAKVAALVNLAAPNPGDSSSLEVELKVPVYSNGAISAYILFGLGFEAEREIDELTVSSQITFGAGFTTWGFDANFRIGLFMESQAKDATGVMNLISYGLYRQVRAIKPEAADSLWGQGGKSGKKEVEEAELWAAMIEEQDLKKEGNHVDVGMLWKAGAEANAKVAKLEASLSGKHLNRYDKETIAQMTTAGFGESTDLAKLEEKANALRKGVKRHVIEAEAAAEVKLGGNSVNFGVEASAAIMNNRLRELSFKGSGSIPFAYGEDAAEWAKIAAKTAAPIAGAAKNAFGIIRSKVKKETDVASKAAGSTVDAGTDILFTVPGFDEAGKSLAEAIQGDETVNDTIRGWLTGDSSASATETVNKIALSSSLDLSIEFSKEWDKAGTSDGWEISLEVGETKTFEVDAEIAKVTVEKSKRLGKLTFGGGKLEGDVLGIGFGG